MSTPLQHSALEERRRCILDACVLCRFGPAVDYIPEHARERYKKINEVMRKTGHTARHQAPTFSMGLAHRMPQGLKDCGAAEIWARTFREDTNTFRMLMTVVLEDMVDRGGPVPQPPHKEET